MSGGEEWIQARAPAEAGCTLQATRGPKNLISTAYAPSRPQLIARFAPAGTEPRLNDIALRDAGVTPAQRETICVPYLFHLTGALQ